MPREAAKGSNKANSLYTYTFYLARLACSRIFLCVTHLQESIARIDEALKANMRMAS